MVTEIEAGAFRSCKSLRRVTFTNSPSIVSIGFDIINGCDSLELFEIPSTVKNIGFGAFSGSTGLLRFNVSKDNVIYRDVDGVLFYKDNETLFCFPGGRNQSIISNKVIAIASMAFRECRKLKSVIFDGTDRINSIDSFTFYGCSALKNIELPGSVERIEAEAFSGCSSLSTVVFADGSKLGKLSTKVFSGCVELSEFRFEGTSELNEIGDLTFEGCSSLIRIDLVNISTIGSRAFFECTSLKSLILPPSLRTLKPNAFGNCISLNQVLFCGSLGASYASDAFGGSGLKYIYVPASFPEPRICGLPAIRVLDSLCRIPTFAFSQIAKFGSKEAFSEACFLACANLSVE